MELSIVADYLDDNGRLPIVAAMLRDIDSREPAPFVTGSRAYGTPRPESDYDIVALVTNGEAEYLAEKIMERGASNGGGASLRIDAWNIIAMSHRNEFDAWLKATNELISERPVSRDRAIEVIERHKNPVAV